MIEWCHEISMLDDEMYSVAVQSVNYLIQKCEFIQFDAIRWVYF